MFEIFYPNLPYKKSQPFSLNRSDVWRLHRIKNITRSCWYITFINNHMKLTWVFLMKEKLEVGPIFQKFNNMVQTQFQTKIQNLKMVNVKKYFVFILTDYLIKEGIFHLSFRIDTP